MNWTIRNRVVAACVAVFALGMGAERWRSNGRPSGPIESSPVLMAAVESLDAGRAVDAIELLKKLSDWYPHSSLPLVYLSFAYDACRQESDAELCFQRVLGSPSETKELVEWVSRHPELRKRLERFAGRRDERARFYKERDGLVGSDRQQVLRTQYMLGKRALEFALEGQVDPESQADSESSTFMLAQFEDGLGDYETVCKRADQALTWHRSHPGADYEAQGKIERQVFKWRWLRCRSATKLADDLRKQGAKDGPERALRHLLVAEDDLRQCRLYLSAFETTPKDRQFVEGIRVDFLLTRTETELDLGHLGKADAHLKSSTIAMKSFRALCLLVENQEPKYLALWEERLRQVTRRLEEARKVARENNIQPTNQHVAAGLPEGDDRP